MQYADPVADLLDQWGVFRARLFRESCVFHRGNYVKDLSRLGRELSNVIIVDNSPASYIFHPENAVSSQTARIFVTVRSYFLLTQIPQYRYYDIVALTIGVFTKYLHNYLFDEYSSVDIMQWRKKYFFTYVKVVIPQYRNIQLQVKIQSQNVTK